MNSMRVKIINGKKQKARSIRIFIFIAYIKQCTVSSLFDIIISMKNLVLMGIKHSGKSTLGKALSLETDLPFFDIDTVIEQNNGITVRNLYIEQGEEGFKKAEIEATKTILGTLNSEYTQYPQKSAVISTGGGICVNEKAVSLLKENGLFIYLDISEEVSITRIIETSKKTGSYPAYISKHDPKTIQDVKDIFHTFYVSRVLRYKALADICITLDTSTNFNKSVEENCRRIISYLPNPSI